MNQKQNLIDLISKLNDRNLQKRRESGVTLYVLIALAIFLLVETINLFPNIFAFVRIEVFMQFALGIFSILVGVYFLVHLNSETMILESRIRLIRKEFDKSSFLEVIVDHVFILLPTACAVISLFYSRNWFFISMAILFVTLFVTYAISNRKSRSRSSFELTKLKNTGKPENLKHAGTRVIVIFSTILIILPVVFYCTSVTLIPNEIISEAIKTSLYLYSLPIVLEYIFEMIRAKQHDTLLQELEKDVYIKNLSDDQIRTILKEQYLGIGFDEWFANQKLIWSSFFQELDEKISQVKSLRANIFKIDSSEFPHEVKGRKSELKEILEGILANIQMQAQKFDSALRNIRFEFADDVTSDERDKLNEFVKQTAKQIHDFRKELSNLGAIIK